jgi:altronate dehydratase small subunit
VTPGAWDAIAIDPRDDVAVLLRDVAAGETVRVRAGGAVEALTAAGPVALGHKIARRAIGAGSPVLKYGEIIASATAAIPAGAHVHVHNVASNRARGGRN